MAWASSPKESDKGDGPDRKDLGQDAQATKSSEQDAVVPLRFPADGEHTPISKRRGAFLPHWTREGGVYFVTFRLFDSLPQPVLMRWIAERNALVGRAERESGTLSTAEEQALRRFYSERVEKYLDTGHGKCLLLQYPVARIVADALKHFHNNRYALYAWCVMPNHVHVLVQPLKDWKLEAILHNWKSYTAKAANRVLGRCGPFWQQESFDHLIRSQKEFEEKTRYILCNPQEAGLTKWRWFGTGPNLGNEEPT